ncbi:MAG: hypothetical protein E7378_01665 [Clostridiales bacterium]|nr:hypothetical protein [Clostridiales bacterium]
MNNKILDKAMARITARRIFAEEQANRFLQQAYQNQEFKELYKQQKEQEIELARKEAYGETVDYSILEELHHKQEFVLNKLGLNGTDLTPNYECVYCHDTGYVKGAPCACLKKEINKELMEYSGFSHRLATFEDNKYDHPAFDLMQKWCNTKSTKINVLISGHTGTGKTFLTECIASELMSKNGLVLFTTAFNLNNKMLNYHISFEAGRDEIIKPFLDCEYLIIDDLGTEPMLKNVTKEYLYLIINERMLAGKPIIITTNLDMNDILVTYGERIFSRLVNKKTSIAICLEGEDLRLKKD